MHHWLLLSLALISMDCARSAKCADTAEDFAQAASQAFAAGKGDEAVRLATRAVEAQPDNMRWRRFRANLHVARREHVQAIADYDEYLRGHPDAAEVFDARGSEHFTLGHINESIADFDRCIALRPDQEISHWKRGISYYYAGKYTLGRKQFEGYQTFDDNDVENAVWRYLCMARSEGVKKARASLLKIKADTRVPMMQVYALYAGQLKPDDVLAAARAGDPPAEALNARLFYAHLYLGLYYETEKDPAKSLEHLTIAESHKIGHYMWDVAHVHADLLRKQKSD